MLKRSRLIKIVFIPTCVLSVVIASGFYFKDIYKSVYKSVYSDSVSVKDNKLVSYKTENLNEVVMKDVNALDKNDYGVGINKSGFEVPKLLTENENDSYLAVSRDYKLTRSFVFTGTPKSKVNSKVLVDISNINSDYAKVVSENYEGGTTKDVIKREGDKLSLSLGSYTDTGYNIYKINQVVSVKDYDLTQVKKSDKVLSDVELKPYLNKHENKIDVLPGMEKGEFLKPYEGKVYLINGASKEEQDVINKAWRNYLYVTSSMTYDTDIKYANQGSASAFLNEVGVCEDFADLFIALCRAQNIPARYVSGYLADVNNTNAYNDYVNEKLHAWAEFYVPHYGWIPVDCVYQQKNHNPVAFGQLASDHLPLAYGTDFRIGKITMMPNSNLDNKNSTNELSKDYSNNLSLGNSINIVVKAGNVIEEPMVYNDSMNLSINGLDSIKFKKVSN